ncbi:uncharacterized protein LOC143289854 isoform X2 [Babylonia areolata]|uniref:uncharacterized protein LOC143289854 isoform X2 n=1 Tax=Babylonia areolata TaxID=304850 RepID=UPI003FD548A7
MEQRWFVNGRPALPHPSEQQIFDFIKCEVLTSLRQMLTRSLIPDRHTDFLRSQHVLSEEDCEEILCQQTRQKQASKFLNILEKKGAEAYNALCASLKEEGTQMFLLRALHEDFERRQRSYRDVMGQQRSEQIHLDLAPPAIKPPPPPSSHHHHHHHHHAGTGTGTSTNDLSPPAGKTSPGFYPPCPSFPSSSTPNACPGYASVSTGPVSPSTDGSCGTFATDGCREEGATKVVDLQKQKEMYVAAYLLSLQTAAEDGDGEAVGADTVTGVSARPEFTELPPTSIVEHLSTTATCGSSMGHNSNTRTGLAALPTVLPHPTQDSQKPSAADSSIVVRHHQLQQISSRGLPQEVGNSVTPAGGVSAGHPSLLVSSGSEPVENEDRSMDPSSLPLPVIQSLEPVENEDTSLENSDFFGSLGNRSLAPSSSGVGSIAISDQQEALDKCACSPKGEEKESVKAGEELLNLNTPVTSSMEQTSNLSCISSCHNTDKKTVVQPSSLPHSLQSCTAKESSEPSSTEEDGGGKEGGPKSKEGMVFEEGMSRETRGSVYDKSGSSQHSSQC